ncbi:DDB1- and CUL4-associated factor 12 [Biomphalaria pfeifferi]|uniref:DDB1- and CUL4-associated factor 12 n=1 Tax=Biomphalaria pfeifferi TaxID=112525 RepID=A0AAD8F8K7_BIOPF|nr:DDB1- and CUL4-associated factor 12 [Biomphalaria pfeifferi]
MDINPEELLRRRRDLTLEQLRQSQRQLVREIQDRYNELGIAVDHLRSYFSHDDSDEDHDNSSSTKMKCKQRNKQCSKFNKIARPLSSETPRILRDREYGHLTSSKHDNNILKFYSDNLRDFVSQHLPSILKEKEMNLGTINKIFASKWLNDSQVVIGTKCNKLMVMDVRNNNLVHIQSLKSTKESIPAECPCGIHSIAINPSRTLLATGAQNTNDLAVYELPTFDPLCVGEQAHKDWIFDMDWVDDEHVITGSRDSSLALWCVDSQGLSTESAGEPHMHGHRVIVPFTAKVCNQAHRVRALTLGRKRGVMGVLSMNAKFHFWDIQTFRQLESVDLTWKRENVCTASSEEMGLFAVGSQAYVTLLDQRSGGEVKSTWLQIPSRHGERGIRSLSFNQNIITIGTGDGRVLFFDMRISKFLYNIDNEYCELQAGNGWLRYDANYREHFNQCQYPNAIYTHCYDENKVRLFAAGGPLPAGLYGNYAGLFY